MERIIIFDRDESVAEILNEIMNIKLKEVRTSLGKHGRGPIVSKIKDMATEYIKYDLSPTLLAECCESSLPESSLAKMTLEMSMRYAALSSAWVAVVKDFRDKGGSPHSSPPEVEDAVVNGFSANLTSSVLLSMGAYIKENHPHLLNTLH